MVDRLQALTPFQLTATTPLSTATNPLERRVTTASTALTTETAQHTATLQEHTVSEAQPEGLISKIRTWCASWFQRAQPNTETANNAQTGRTRAVADGFSWFWSSLKNGIATICTITGFIILGLLSLSFATGATVGSPITSIVIAIVTFIAAFSIWIHTAYTNRIRSDYTELNEDHRLLNAENQRLTTQHRQLNAENQRLNAEQREVMESLKQIGKDIGLEVQSIDDLCQTHQEAALKYAHGFAKMWRVLQEQLRSLEEENNRKEGLWLRLEEVVNELKKAVPQLQPMRKVMLFLAQNLSVRNEELTLPAPSSEQQELIDSNDQVADRVTQLLNQFDQLEAIQNSLNRIDPQAQSEQLVQILSQTRLASESLSDIVKIQSTLRTDMNTMFQQVQHMIANLQLQQQQQGSRVDADLTNMAQTLYERLQQILQMLRDLMTRVANLEEQSEA